MKIQPEKGSLRKLKEKVHPKLEKILLKHKLYVKNLQS